MLRPLCTCGALSVRVMCGGERVFVARVSTLGVPYDRPVTRVAAEVLNFAGLMCVSSETGNDQELFGHRES